MHKMFWQSPNCRWPSINTAQLLQTWSKLTYSLSKVTRSCTFQNGFQLLIYLDGTYKFAMSKVLHKDPSRSIFYGEWDHPNNRKQSQVFSPCSPRALVLKQAHNPGPESPYCLGHIHLLLWTQKKIPGQAAELLQCFLLNLCSSLCDLSARMLGSPCWRGVCQTSHSSESRGENLTMK